MPDPSDGEDVVVTISQPDYDLFLKLLDKSDKSEKIVESNNKVKPDFDEQSVNVNGNQVGTRTKNYYSVNIS